MGLFSGISKALFGDPTKGIRSAADKQMRFQQQALDYLKEVDAPMLAMRNRINPMLEGFYTGDPEIQQQILNTARSSPFYQQMLNMGQEGVLADAGAMGLSRSGDTTRALTAQNQQVLQGLVNQNLAGLTGLSNPQLRSGGIANIYQNMGQTAGQSGIAETQARQNMAGQGLNILTGLAGLF